VRIKKRITAKSFMIGRAVARESEGHRDLVEAIRRVRARGPAGKLFWLPSCRFHPTPVPTSLFCAKPSLWPARVRPPGVGGPFGAILVQGGLIVGRGQNRVTSTHDPTAHAEVRGDFARRARRSGSSIWAGATALHELRAVSDVSGGGLLGAGSSALSMPARATTPAAIGFDDAVLYRELALGLGERRVPMVPLLRAEGVAVFSRVGAQSQSAYHTECRRRWRGRRRFCIHEISLIIGKVFEIRNSKLESRNKAGKFECGNNPNVLAPRKPRFGISDF